MQFNHYGAEFAKARMTLLNMPLSPLERELIALQGRLTGIAMPMQNPVVETLRNDFDREAEERVLSSAIPAQSNVLAALAQLDTETRQLALAASHKARPWRHAAPRGRPALGSARAPRTTWRGWVTTNSAWSSMWPRSATSCRSCKAVHQRAGAFGTECGAAAPRRAARIRGRLRDASPNGEAGPCAAALPNPPLSTAAGRPARRAGDLPGFPTRLPLKNRRLRPNQQERTPRKGERGSCPRSIW